MFVKKEARIHNDHVLYLKPSWILIISGLTSQCFLFVLSYPNYEDILVLTRGQSNTFSRIFTLNYRIKIPKNKTTCDHYVVVK